MDPKAEEGASSSTSKSRFQVPLELGEHNFLEFVEQFDNFLLDLDGTIWYEDGLTPVENVAKTYEFLKSLGKNVFFVTNNAQFTREQFVKKLERVAGIKDVKKGEIYTAGHITMRYLKKTLKKYQKAYVMCSQGLKEELENNGVRFLGFGSDSAVVEPFQTSASEIASFKLDEDVKAVLCAIDPWFNSTKIFKAASYLRDESVAFLSTEMSGPTRPLPGLFMFGTGSLVKGVAAATGGRTPTVLGKPNVFMFEEICQDHLGIEKRRTVMIGDSMSSDMAFAESNGISSLLVLTGSTSRTDCKNLEKKILRGMNREESRKGWISYFGEKEEEEEEFFPIPSYVISSLGDVGKWGKRGAWLSQTKRKAKSTTCRAEPGTFEEDPSLPRNILPYDQRGDAHDGRPSLAAFDDPWHLFVVTGGPGSGKGTQGRLLADKYGFVHLSAGELLRTEVAWETDRGKEFKEILDRRGTIGIMAGLEMIRDHMLARALTGATGFIIDGNPKDMHQGELFEQMIGSASGVISMEVGDEQRIKRLVTRGKTSGWYRGDDDKRTIVKRLKAFHKKKGPVVKYFDDKGKLAKINGEGSVEEVQEALVRQMDKWLLQDSKVVFIVGGPGSGKGTQCQQLKEKYGLSHLSSGDLLRAEVASGSPQGQELEEMMQRGELVPMERVLTLIRRAMVQKALQGCKGFLIDGFPREIPQGKAFEKEIRGADVCLYFNASDATLLERLAKRGETSGRADDNEDTINARLQVFHEHTAPVVDYYRSRGKLVEVSAEEEPEVVFQETVRHLDRLVFPAPTPSADEELLRDCRAIFVVGGPGCGKGTQCERLKEKYQLVHLSSGDLLRVEVEGRTSLGQRMEEMMKQGQLVPMETVLTLLRDAMVTAARRGQRGFLIDGYPRDVSQGLAFEEKIVPCSVCLHFNATDETMTSRLLHRGETSGRSDDDATTIKKRLETFHAETLPVIGYYAAKGKLVSIDAEAPPEVVFEKTVAALEEIGFRGGPPPVSFQGGFPDW